MVYTATRLSLDATKQVIDEKLEAFFTEREQEAATIHPRYEQLWQALHVLMLAGGKRLRPYMLLGAYSAYSDQDAKHILSAAVAQELLHMAMLIHDDIIDRDDIRYGVQNISGQYKAAYSPLLTSADERGHMALSAAVLAGDALLSEAHAMLTRIETPTLYYHEAHEIFRTGIFQVIGGELLDTELPFLPSGTVSPEVIARYKTASYSFVSPLIMGAALAGVDISHRKLLRTFAEALGIAYQLRDDVLGVFGNENSTGKSASSDITEGKRTLLVDRFDALATAEQKEQFYALFHNVDASAEDISRARALLQQSGALESIEDEITERSLKLSNMIDGIAESPDAREFYTNLVEYCLDRSS